MGYSGWSSDAYTNLSRSYVGKSADDIFSSSAVSDMLPKGVDVREARDSDEHPNSLAVMVFLDVTGSMGHIPEAIVKNKLGALMNTIIDNGVPDHKFFSVRLVTITVTVLHFRLVNSNLEQRNWTSG